MSRVIYERLGHLAHIRLNRPEQQNRFTMEMLSTVGRLCAAAEDDPDIRCLLITGSGEDFCLGGDIAEIVPAWARGINPFGPEDINPMGVSARRLTKPLITIVQGRCTNGGLEIALASDICIAADDAQFAFEEIHYATYPVGGGTFRFVRAAGRSCALRYVLTGDTFDAQEAFRMNLVATVKPVGEVHEFGLALAKRVSNAAPLALQSALAQIDVWANRGDAAALESTIPDVLRLLNTADVAEAMRARQENRAPVFIGR